MSITWTTSGVAPVERVKFGLLESDLNYIAHSTSHTFDWNYQKDTGDFYYTSGFIHEALMVNLVPGKKHFYQVSGGSGSQNFTGETVLICFDK